MGKSGKGIFTGICGCFEVRDKMQESRIKITMHPPFSIGIIISTYNNPIWLEKIFWGYMNQTVNPDEIIIADDGSNEETKRLIDSYSDKLPIKHVWHEDNGFQKSRILNKAIIASTADYLVFTDQDCIPRKDFVETHLRFAEKGCFLSGGYFRLPMSISKQLSEEDVDTGRAFDVNWLRKQGLKRGIKNLKLTTSAFVSSLMNAITPANATFNGCNSSVWKKDILAVNGFDEQLQYGGQDRELGERLINAGLKPKKIRYSAVCLHLDHKRPYKTVESVAKNKEIRMNTRRNKIVETSNGIKQNQ